MNKKIIEIEYLEQRTLLSVMMPQLSINSFPKKTDMNMGTTTKLNSGGLPSKNIHLPSMSPGAAEKSFSTMPPKPSVAMPRTTATVTPTPTSDPSLTDLLSDPQTSKAFDKAKQFVSCWLESQTFTNCLSQAQFSMDDFQILKKSSQQFGKAIKSYVQMLPPMKEKAGKAVDLFSALVDSYSKQESFMDKLKFTCRLFLKMGEYFTEPVIENDDKASTSSTEARKTQAPTVQKQ